MAAETALAFVASSYGILMAISPLLQIRAILRHQSSQGVSASYQGVLLVGFALWLAYGIASDNWAIVVPNTVALVISALTIVVTRHYRELAPAGEAAVAEGEPGGTALATGAASADRR